MSEFSIGVKDKDSVETRLVFSRDFISWKLSNIVVPASLFETEGRASNSSNKKGKASPTTADEAIASPEPARDSSPSVSRKIDSSRRPPPERNLRNAPAGEPEIGHWFINETKDAITDKRIVSAGIGNADGLMRRFQCSGDKFVAAVAPLTPMMNLEFITMDEQSPVAWRIDSEPPITETWRVMPGRAGGGSYALVSLALRQYSWVEKAV